MAFFKLSFVQSKFKTNQENINKNKQNYYKCKKVAQITDQQIRRVHFKILRIIFLCQIK